MPDKKKPNPNAPEAVIDRCTDIPWLCTACKGLLGFVDKETRSVVRVKHRDLYLYVENPERMIMVCRSCGAQNVLSQIEEDNEENS
jgi:hypothetical protein